MNLPQFLKEVDRLTDVLSHDELSEFIHEIARILPESQRDSFVDMLLFSKGWCQQINCRSLSQKRAG